MRGWAGAVAGAWLALACSGAQAQLVVDAVRRNLNCMSYGLLDTLAAGKWIIAGIACASLMAWVVRTWMTGRPDAGWLSGILAATAIVGLVGAGAGFFTGDPEIAKALAEGDEIGGAYAVEWTGKCGMS